MLIILRFELAKSAQNLVDFCIKRQFSRVTGLSGLSGRLQDGPARPVISARERPKARLGPGPVQPGPAGLDTFAQAAS